MAAIEVRGLQKIFRLRERAPGLRGSLGGMLRPRYREITAVASLTFGVEAGESVAFLGPNGAGKSTTIKMLTGILHPTAGTAEVLGLTPWRQRERLAYRIGTVFGQRSQLWYHLPPADTFALLARIYELDEQRFRRRLGELVERFGLGPHLHTPVRKLSLGERMRCEIAASLLHQPQVLFLDEPTIGLDVLAKAAVRDLIRQANREEGVTVFLTSHDAGDVEELCRRAMVVDRGRLIFEGPVGALRRDYLKTKRVRLHLADDLGGLDMAGVRVVERADRVHTLEVDAERQPIEPVLARILAEHRILDITVEDPPMEQLIAAIYRSARPGRGEAAHA